MLIPIIILSLVSSIFIYNSSIDNITQESTNTLTIIDDNLNIVLSTSAYQYDLLTYNPQLIISLEKLFQNTAFEYTDLIFSKSIKASLNAVAQAHSYIYSIYLYIDGYNTYLCSENGITDLNTSKDQLWHSIYQNTNKESMWITKRTVKEYTYAKPKNYLTMFRPMSNMKGAIIVNINIKEFEKVLNNAGSDGTQLLLLDNQGEILCNSDNSSDSITVYADFFSNNNSVLFDRNNLNKATFLTIGNEKLLAQTLSNSQYGITLVSLVPLEKIFAHLIPAILVMLGEVVSNCIISLLLAYFITKKNFHQIASIIQTFDDAEKGKFPEKSPSIANDEYDVILNNVISVFLNSSYLDNQLNEHQYKQKLAEMAALQLQINPHFLFNTLQAIDFEALRLAGAPCTLNRMIQNLSDILKYALGNPMTQVSLNDELNYLKKYTDIQKQRLGDKFIIYYEVDESLLNLSVFRLLLQPLVENSIQHGISPLDFTGYIKVRIYQRNNYAYFSVIDNGIGLTKAEIHELYTRISNNYKENIGLTNINRRLILNYGVDSTLRIQGKKGMGTCVSFKLPLNTSMSDHKKSML